jgi:hypothetical protein
VRVKQLLAVLILIVVAWGKANSPISAYMRDTGLLYLESVESLTLACGHDIPLEVALCSTLDKICPLRRVRRMLGVAASIHYTTTAARLIPKSLPVGIIS